MRIKFIITAVMVLSVFAVLTLSGGALALPAADLRMSITELDVRDSATEFTMQIDVSAPSEPYASLDFNLVSSNSESLQIIDNSEAGDRSDLDIEFTPNFSGAYHKGRIDETSGAISYLIGIFSMEGGNKVTEGTNICSIRFRYTGEAEEQISLDNLKLVYKNTDGAIESVNHGEAVKYAIGPATFVQVPSEEVPLANGVPKAIANGPAMMILVLSALSLLGVVWFRKTRRSAP